MPKSGWSFSSTCLVAATLVLATVSAQVEVGVRMGDRIEYEFEYSGDPPENRTETSRIEVLSISGTQVELRTTAMFSNGTDDVKTDIYDVETGVTDFFIIPAGLSKGDRFFHEDVGGNITIEDEMKIEVAGAQRNVLKAWVGTLDLRWDQDTGVLVHAEVDSDGYGVVIDVVGTNMWRSEGPEGEDSGFPMVYTAIGIVVVIVLLVLAMVTSRRSGDGDAGPPEIEPGVRM